MTITRNRTLKLAQTARLLGKYPKRIREWCDAGCPHDREGKEYRLHMMEVVEWYAAREVAAASPSPSRQSPKDRLIELQIVEQETKNATRRGELVEASAVEAAWGSIMEVIRGKLLPIGGKVGAMIGGKVGRTVKAMIDDLIHKALTALATGKEADD